MSFCPRIDRDAIQTWQKLVVAHVHRAICNCACGCVRAHARVRACMRSPLRAVKHQEIAYARCQMLLDPFDQRMNLQLHLQLHLHARTHTHTHTKRGDSADLPVSHTYSYMHTHAHTCTQRGVTVQTYQSRILTLTRTRIHTHTQKRGDSADLPVCATASRSGT